MYKLDDRLQMLPSKRDQMCKFRPPLHLKVMTDGSQHGPSGSETVCVFQDLD